MSLRPLPLRIATLLAVVSAMVSLGRAGAQPPKDFKAAAEEKRTTVTYDVADLAARYPDGIEELLVIVMRTIHPEDWRKGVNTLQLVNGNKLVIDAPAATQKEIAEYLKAWNLNFDADVIVQGKLYEVERDVFDKKIKPLLSKQSEEKSMEELLKVLSQAKLLESGIEAIHDRQEARFFSFRQAYLFKRWTEDRFSKTQRDKAYELGFHGVSYKARVFVRGDRRSVGVRLSEHVTQLEEIGNAKEFNSDSGKPEPSDFPKTLDKNTTYPIVEVDDGCPIIRHLTWKSMEARKNGREMVLVVRPVIYIEAEEKMRRQLEKGKEKK